MQVLEREYQRRLELYEKASADLDKAARALELARSVQALQQHDVVNFEWGRGERRKDYVGTVLGWDESSKSSRLKVFVGSGADAEIKSIQPRSIKAVHKMTEV